MIEVAISSFPIKKNIMKFDHDTFFVFLIELTFPSIPYQMGFAPEALERAEQLHGKEEFICRMNGSVWGRRFGDALWKCAVIALKTTRGEHAASGDPATTDSVGPIGRGRRSVGAPTAETK